MASYLLDTDVEFNNDMNELWFLYNIVINRKLKELKKAGKSEQELNELEFLYNLDLEGILSDLGFDGSLKRKRILKKLREKVIMYDVIDANTESFNSSDNILFYRKFFQSRVDDGLSNDCDSIDELVFKTLMMSEEERLEYFDILDKRDMYDIKKANDRLVFLECLKKDTIERVESGKLKNRARAIELFVEGKVACYNARLRDYSVEEKKEALGRLLDAGNESYRDIKSIPNSIERLNRIKLELFFSKVSSSIKKA